MLLAFGLALSSFFLVNDVGFLKRIYLKGNPIYPVAKIFDVIAFSIQIRNIFLEFFDVSLDFL